jgi:hypothetical protein
MKRHSTPGTIGTLIALCCYVVFLLLSILVSVGIPIALIWIVIHFALKYW